MNTPKRYVRLIQRVACAALGLCLLAGMALASDAPDDALAISNTLQMSDWITLSTEEETQSVSVQIRWLPSDENAPANLTAVLDDGQTQTQAVLTRANSWSATMDAPASGSAYTASLLGATLHYTTEITGTDVVFSVYTDTETETTDTAPESAPVQAQSERRASIFPVSNANKPLMPGDSIALQAVLEGYDNVPYSLQWQLNDGNGWQDIPGANSSLYSFTLDDESEHWNLRVAVAVNEISID